MDSRLFATEYPMSAQDALSGGGQFYFATAGLKGCTDSPPTLEECQPDKTDAHQLLPAAQEGKAQLLLVCDLW